MGGLWTSSFNKKGGAWVDFCRMESFSPEEKVNPCNKRYWWCLKPKKGTRVLTIDRFADLKLALKKYPYRFTDSQVRQMTFGMKKFERERYLREIISQSKFLNYEKICEDYDAIHLTEKGQIETRRPANPPNLYGWDVESTLWCKFKFDKVERCRL